MKATTFVLSLVLGFMAIGVLGLRTPAEEFDQNHLVEFNQNYLVLQWPQSYCNTSAPSKCQRQILPHYFTIHGLWPQKDTKRVTCSGQPEFNYGLINGNTELVNDLERFWPNLESKETDQDGNKRFWKHEWERHGACTTGIFGKSATAQWDYFYRTVALAKKVGLTDPVSIKRIIKPGTKYTTDQIRNAIERATKVTPRLKCNIDKNKTYQLYEVVLCADKYATQLKNCTKDGSSCPTKGNPLIAFPEPPSPGV